MKCRHGITIRNNWYECWDCVYDNGYDEKTIEEYKRHLAKAEAESRALYNAEAPARVTAREKGRQARIASAKRNIPKLLILRPLYYGAIWALPFVILAFIGYLFVNDPRKDLMRIVSKLGTVPFWLGTIYGFIKGLWQLKSEFK
jgi:hypothetical protein